MALRAATPERVSPRRQASSVGAEGTASLERSNAGPYDIDGRHYYVRQMKNLKASIPVEWLTGASFNFYAWACEALLARAHAGWETRRALLVTAATPRFWIKALAEWPRATEIRRAGSRDVS